MKYKQFTEGDNFIAQYMRAMQSIETSEAYDFWCALWCISAVLDRKIYVDRPKLPVRLNMFALLVADSGVTRKSTAVRCARNLMREFMKQNSLQTELIESRTTPEQLEYLMHEQSKEHGYARINIIISELVRFLGKEKYNTAMPGLLTDLYDCPEEQVTGGTVSRGKLHLLHVYLNFLSASTPAWLLTTINDAVVEGGFTSRCYFIHSEEPKARIAWPKEEDDVDYDSLAFELKQVKAVADNSTKLKLTDAAIKRFELWYSERELHRDAFRASFEAREDDHVLRIAALLCIADRRFTIEQRDIARAINVITSVKESGARIFEDRLTTSEVVAAIEKLRKVLIDGGIQGLPQSMILRKVQNYMKSETLNDVLEIMHELNMVQRFETKIDGTRGRTRVVWRATRHILENDGIVNITKMMEV